MVAGETNRTKRLELAPAFLQRCAPPFLPPQPLSTFPPCLLPSRLPPPTATPLANERPAAADGGDPAPDRSAAFLARRGAGGASHIRQPVQRAIPAPGAAPSARRVEPIVN